MINLLEWVKDQQPDDQVEKATAELSSHQLVK